MKRNLSDLSSYQYDLPQDLIAKVPLKNRDLSRLLIVNRQKGTFEEITFNEITSLLKPNDQIILNDTQVIRARLLGYKATGAKIEIFLVKNHAPGVWEVLAKPGRKVPPGTEIHFSPQFSCLITETLTEGSKIAKFFYEDDFFLELEKHGSLPIPHYMERDESPEDNLTYQTVYAKNKGAVAAPTAGLHFTEDLLNQLKRNGVSIATLTLHVGWGTFKPVQMENILEHKMHSERFCILPEVAEKINAHKNARQICIGTTTCRSLESACLENGHIRACEGETDIFITPGYQFKFVQALLTNFHLPSSTLLMLVTAFGGYELIMEAYKKAVKDRFRFYSYGDAMLIL